MTSDQVTGGQSILDASGNAKHATNGSSGSADGSDCASLAEGIKFDGSCTLSLQSLALSSRGFSVEMQLKVDTSISSVMWVFQQVPDGKLVIRFRTSTGNVGFSINSNSNKVTGCSAFASGDWMSLAASYVSTGSSTFYQFYCDHTLLGQGTFYSPLDFPLTTFELGTSFTGVMREFKIYQVPLGSESLSEANASNSLSITLLRTVLLAWHVSLVGLYLRQLPGPLLSLLLCVGVFRL